MDTPTLSAADESLRLRNLVDAEGNVVAAAQRNLEGTSVVRKGWFQAAKEQPFVGTRMPRM